MRTVRLVALVALTLLLLPTSRPHAASADASALAETMLGRFVLDAEQGRVNGNPSFDRELSFSEPGQHEVDRLAPLAQCKDSAAGMLSNKVADLSVVQVSASNPDEAVLLQGLDRAVLWHAGCSVAFLAEVTFRLAREPVGWHLTVDGYTVRPLMAAQ